MKTANINDKHKVVSIIEESFNDNPSIKWLIKNYFKRKERLRAMAKYLFETGVNKKEITMWLMKSKV